MSKPPTLRVIADHLGVSLQTVSNALQNTGRISAATAERVRQAAHEMGYRPNVSAQALRGTPTRNLAFVISDPVFTHKPSAYLGFLVPLVFSAIREVGYKPSIHFADAGDIEAALLPLRQSLVDGVILTTSSLEASQVETLARAGTPVVLFERSAAEGTLPYVTVDAAEGIAMAVRHVWEAGARRIAYLDGRPHWPMTTSSARYEGFHQAIAELGLPVPANVSGNWSFESGISAFAEFLSSGPLPDAVVCANDQMAVGLLRAAQDHGLRIPHDMMITGFDDLEFAQYTTPQLTSIRLPLQEMSRAAARRLSAMLSGNQTKKLEQIFRAELVVRGSSSLATGDHKIETKTQDIGHSAATHGRET